MLCVVLGREVEYVRGVGGRWVGALGGLERFPYLGLSPGEGV